MVNEAGEPEVLTEARGRGFCSGMDLKARPGEGCSVEGPKAFAEKRKPNWTGS